MKTLEDLIGHTIRRDSHREELIEHILKEKKYYTHHKEEMYKIMMVNCETRERGIRLYEGDKDISKSCDDFFEGDRHERKILSLNVKLWPDSI